MTESQPVAAPAPSDFECPRCGKKHPWKEIGFAWPDASFALTIPQDEQAKIRQGENEDTLAIRDRLFFIRGWAPVQVEGTGTYGIGFWIQVTKKDFADVNQRDRIKHRKYVGRIANQTLVLAPTLGTRAEMEFRGEGLRPTIRFTDEHHPFTKAQQTRLPLEVVRAWMAEGFHKDEPEALGKPLVGKLETHGWVVVDPEQAGKAAVTFTVPPRQGDFLKLIVAFLAADENGDPAALIAGWWVRLDDMRQPDLWSGTLRNYPRVPSTLLLGSRLWFKPSQVIAVDAQQADSGVPQ